MELGRGFETDERKVTCDRKVEMDLVLSVWCR
jgi:hypothetical protein